MCRRTYSQRGKHALALFRSLREFATAPSTAPTREDVHGMVAEAVELVRDGLRRDRPTLADRLAVEMVIDDKLAVTAHRHRIVQALRNLIQNAAESYDKAPEATASVAVRAVAKAGTVTLSIADRGCGMGEEARRDAFHLFATSKLHGTGIGLALVQSVIESEHHGRVSLASEPGAGTTITVTLPTEQPANR